MEKKDNNAIVVIDSNTGKKIVSLSEKIERDQANLEEALKKLSETKSPIEVKRTLVVAANGKSVEENLSNIYNELSGYIDVCGNAVRSTNNNLINVLDLVTILTKIEADLYEKFETGSISKEMLTRKFDEFCEIQNIKNEHVKEILRITSERNFALRGRIIDLNQKVAKGLSSVFNSKIYNITILILLIASVILSVYNLVM